MALIEGMYATSFVKAFFLNALTLAIVAVGAIELRQTLNDDKSNAYLFFNNLLSGKAMSEIQKGGIIFMSSFILSIFTYLMMYLIFGFGGGLLSAKAAFKPAFTKLGTVKRLVTEVVKPKSL